MQVTSYRLEGIQAGSRLKLAVVADIHDHPYEIVEASLQQEKPDAILMPGDIIRGILPEGSSSKLEESDHALDMLRCFGRIAPSFLSLGNHEWMLDNKDTDLIQEAGVTLLDDSYTRFDRLVIGGLTSGRVIRHRKEMEAGLLLNSERFRYTNEPLRRQLFPKEQRISEEFYPQTEWLGTFLAEPGYHILLSHHPEYWAYPPVSLQGFGIELVISGHAHGGQFRFPGLRDLKWHGVFAPNQGLFPKYTEGRHDHEGSTLIISRGLSNTARPIPRLFNPMELVYITLEPDPHS